MDELALELDKVRAGQHSKLPAQSKPAHLLLAIDETQKESKHAASPTFYFASLLATLQTLVSGSKAQEDMVAATVYLLGIVTPLIAGPVLTAKSENLILVLGRLYKTLMVEEDSAAVTKSALAIVESLYCALPPNHLSRLEISQLYNSTLPLLSDTRPKVRRRAQDAIQAISFATNETDVKQKSKHHPYAERTAEWVIAALEENAKTARKLIGSANSASSAKKPDEIQSRLMGLVAFVKAVASEWPADQLKPLIATLLSLPKAGNNFLTRASYDIFEILFTKAVTSSLPVATTLSELIALKPQPTATAILPGWLSAVEHGFIALYSIEPATCTSIFHDNFTSILSFCASSVTSAETRQRAEATAIGMIRWCLDVDEAAIRHAIDSENTPTASEKHPLASVCKLLLDALTGIQYRGLGMPHIFGILTQLISRLRVRLILDAPKEKGDPRPPTAASVLLFQHIELVGNMRAVTTFEYKDSAESVLGMACEVCGPRWLLNTLPLNIFNDEEAPSEVGRAWMLPILRGRITNTTLGHFVEDLVPLSEKLFGKKIEVGAVAGKGAEIQAKVYEALVDQIWALLPGYCDLPVDLSTAFNKQFAELLSQILYNQPNLRPIIFRSLQILVERNVAVANATTPAEVSMATFGIDSHKAKAHVKLLGSAAPSLLSVMFNVYSKANRETSGYMLDCISAYFSVLPVKEIATIHGRIAGLLKTSLLATNNDKVNADKAPAYAMLDIMIALAAVAQGPTANALYEMAIGNSVLNSADATVQKKGYRILLKLFESKAASGLQSKMQILLQLLGEKLVKPAASAKKDRTELLRKLVEMMPSDQLHLLLPILSEAILATKEANEKSRAAGYDLFVMMARKMQSGGTIKRSMVPGMADSMDTDVEDMPASLAEYFTMVAAGLTSSPHMISATVTALSRLLFEFHQDLEATLIDDLVKTVIVFLHSKTREVVKSALGFVKVIIVSLPNRVVAAHLPELIEGLLNWSSDHKNHFNVKVRHIFERLIRKYGFESVSGHVGPEHQKLMQNIRKRQLRAKRKKLQQNEEGGDDALSSGDEVAAPRKGFQSAFDEAIKDSESDISASSGDEQAPRSKFQKGKGKQRKQPETAFLPDDGDTPMNLLDQAQLSRMTVRNPKRQKAVRETDDNVKMDDKGRLVVKDNELEQADTVASTSAYLEAIRGEDGFNRDKRGNLRANKQKRGREDENDDDQWVDDIEGKLKIDNGDANPSKKRRKIGKEAIGSEFKAKKAGGDVKKNGQQPYAYVPLNKVAGKRTGKRNDIAFVKKGKPGRGRARK